MSYEDNYELTWEKSGEWNVGADFALFNNRLSGSFDYFHKTTTDLLYMKTLPLSSGSAVATYPANVGEMVNQGIEFTVNGDIIKTRNLTLSGNLNLTHFKNKITDLDPSVKANGIKGSSSILRIGGRRPGRQAARPAQGSSSSESSARRSLKRLPVMPYSEARLLRLSLTLSGLSSTEL